MKKVISFSLWGNDPKYTIGAIKNAKLTKSIFPNWECWVYCGESVDSKIIDSLEKENAKIIIKKENGPWTGTFWRFETIADPDVEIFISRDTDSRLSKREFYAVEEWEKSKNLFHVMRDHPAHTVPILAGMWGAKKPILSDINYLIEFFKNSHLWNPSEKQLDQIFLKQIIWPRVSYTTMTHDEIFSSKPFPTQRQNYEFVGDVFDENDVRHPQYWKDIQTIQDMHK